MKTITVKTINGTFENVDLDFADIMNLQSKGSKRTAILGGISTASSISSIFVNNPTVKFTLWSAGLIGAIATIISNNKAIDEQFTDEGQHEINVKLTNVCNKKGIILDPDYYGLSLEDCFDRYHRYPAAAEC